MLKHFAAALLALGLGTANAKPPPPREAEPSFSLPQRPPELRFRDRRGPHDHPCPVWRIGRWLEVSLCGDGRSPFASPYEEDPARK